VHVEDIERECPQNAVGRPYPLDNLLKSLLVPLDLFDPLGDVDNVYRPSGNVFDKTARQQA